MIVTRKAAPRWNRVFLRRYGDALANPHATRTSLAKEFGYATVEQLVAAHECMLKAGVKLPPLPAPLPAESARQPPPKPKLEQRPALPPSSPDPSPVELSPVHVPLPAVPPVRLPEADAYGAATRWLKAWGHTVTWQTFGTAKVPVINGRLSNVAYLCALWHDERVKRFGRTQGK